MRPNEYVDQIEAELKQERAEAASAEPERSAEQTAYVIRFFGSGEQYHKVLAYIEWLGASYEV